MFRRHVAVLAAALATIPAAAAAQSIHQPVKGSVDVLEHEITCAHPNACFFCINDENTTADHRLLVAIGSVLAATEVSGFVEGIVRPFVEIDGVTLTPPLLPTGAFFRSGLRWSDLPFPPSCDGTSPGVIYRIGDTGDIAESGDGDTTIDIPVAEADAIPFRFTVCSQLIYWGAGCNLSGSSPRSWKLHLPGTFNAFVIAAGDAPPLSPPNGDVVVDVVDGPGGVLTVARMSGAPPVGPVFLGANVHWDLRTDMPPGTHTVSLELAFDPATLPPEVDAGDLQVSVLDETLGTWESFPTTIDEVGGSASAEVDRLGVVALIAPPPVPVLDASWGRLKASF